MIDSSKWNIILIPFVVNLNLNHSPYIYPLFVIGISTLLTFPLLFGNFMSLGNFDTARDLFQQDLSSSNPGLVAKDWMNGSLIKNLFILFLVRVSHIFFFFDRYRIIKINLIAFVSFMIVYHDGFHRYITCSNWIDLSHNHNWFVCFDFFFFSLIIIVSIIKGSILGRLFGEIFALIYPMTAPNGYSIVGMSFVCSISIWCFQHFRYGRNDKRRETHPYYHHHFFGLGAGALICAFTQTISPSIIVLEMVANMDYFFPIMVSQGLLSFVWVTTLWKFFIILNDEICSIFFFNFVLDCNHFFGNRQ
jgi:hypothetical protein